MTRPTKIPNPEPPFGDVNVLIQPDGRLKVVVCFAPDNVEAFLKELNTRFFLALDGSRSMMVSYGIGACAGSGTVNVMENSTRWLGKNLADVSRDDRVSAVYWAVSRDGSQIQPIGSYDARAWPQAAIKGPPRGQWGFRTKLLPVLKHAEKIVAEAAMTVGVIVTDGFIDDEEAVRQFCLDLGRGMVGRQPQPLKLILIGLSEAEGEDTVDVAQLTRLDNLFEGTEIDFDLFSHALVEDLKDEQVLFNVVFCELMRDVVARRRGRVLDGEGRECAVFKEGVPGVFDFELPAGQKSFVVHLEDGQGKKEVVSQDISFITNRP